MKKDRTQKIENWTIENLSPEKLKRATGGVKSEIEGMLRVDLAECKKAGLSMEEVLDIIAKTSLIHKEELAKIKMDSKEVAEYVKIYWHIV
jgi:hypothetical protein